MTIGRPFMQLPLDALRAKLGESPGDRTLLEELKHELTFRSTPRAKQLEREVSALLAGRGTAAEARKTRSQNPPAKPSDSDDPAPSTSAFPSDLESRYTALRATFTAEAEILSRWGMTSLAPPHLRKAMFRHWQKELLKSGRQHPLGLGRADLERDLEALKSEKRGS